jgi:hypothetical protein
MHTLLDLPDLSFLGKRALSKIFLCCMREYAAMKTSLTAAVFWIRFQIQEGRKWLNKKMGKGEALYYTYYEELDVFLWRAGSFYWNLEGYLQLPEEIYCFFAISFFLFFRRL